MDTVFHRTVTTLGLFRGSWKVLSEELTPPKKRNKRTCRVVMRIIILTSYRHHYLIMLHYLCFINVSCCSCLTGNAIYRICNFVIMFLTDMTLFFSLRATAVTQSWYFELWRKQTRNGSVVQTGKRDQVLKPQRLVHNNIRTEVTPDPSSLRRTPHCNQLTCIHFSLCCAVASLPFAWISIFQPQKQISAQWN